MPEPDSSSHPVLDQGLTTDEQEQQDRSRREDDYQEQIHGICQSPEIPRVSLRRKKLNVNLGF